MEKTGDVLLIPIVVTTSDVQDFDFSIPVFKSWWVKYNSNLITLIQYNFKAIVVKNVFIIWLPPTSVLYKDLAGDENDHKYNIIQHCYE